MHVIIGLGNPGPDYKHTRHNIGADMVAQASIQWSIPLKFNVLAQLGIGQLKGEPVVLAIPFTYMNRSGEAVWWLVNQFGLENHQLIIVHDDLDIPFGRFRIKFNGGTGGHNGLKSIAMALNSEGFHRFKIGISRPDVGQDPADYVLSPFLPFETQDLAGITERAVTAMEYLVIHGIDDAMNRFNQKV